MIGNVLVVTVPLRIAPGVNKTLRTDTFVVFFSMISARSILYSTIQSNSYPYLNERLMEEPSRPFE